MIRQYTDKKDNKKYYEIKNHYIGKDIYTGREKRISKKGFRTKKDAEQHIIKLKSDFLKVGFQSTQDYTFQDIYELFNEQYKHQVKESTYKSHIYIFKTILKIFADIKITDIKLPFCQRYLNELSKTFKKDYIRTLRTKINMILDYAVKMEIISTNYMKFAKIPRKKEEKKENYYNKSELLEFLELVRTNYNLEVYTCFRLLAFTGIRRGELSALTWKDVNFKDKTLNVDKNIMYVQGKNIVTTTKTVASERIIILDDETLNVLKEFRKSLNFISLDSTIISNGFFFTSNYLKSIYKKFPHLKKISVHGFRHTHATLLYESGLDVKDISDRLGHSDIQTTLNIYTHLTEDKKKDVTDKFSKYMSI